MSAWRVCEYFEMHPIRWDRANPSTPMVEESSIVIDEWLEENSQTIKLPLAIIDAETWRDFDKPVFFGCLIVDRYGGKDDAVVGAEFTGEVDDYTGKKLFKPTPKRWGWSRCSKHLKCRNKERMEKCDLCKRVKPKNYGKFTSKTDNSKRRLRFTRLWCWADELPTVIIPHLMSKKVKRVYAHNSTVDIIAMISALEPELTHPLMKFVQTDPDEFSNLLFRGSKILQCKLDIAPYYNKAFNTTFREMKYNYQDKKFEPNEEYHIKILDSLGVLPLSLGEIGKAVNFPKGETPNKFIDKADPDHQNLFSITTEDIDYCIRDCEVLFRGLQMMWATVKELGYHGSTMPLTAGTLGSQMIAHHNATHQESPLYVKKEKGWKYRTTVKNTQADDIARLSMVGGRTQCFKTEEVKGLITGIDANAFYPSIMVDEENKWPDFRSQTIIREVENSLINIIDEVEGCIHVKWKRPDSDRIGLFAQTNDDGLLDWTLKSGERWISFPEYRFAISQGYDLTICIDEEVDACAVICERMEYNPFKDVITSWYDERLKRKNQGDPSEFALKILLNAGGFGKFLERNTDTMITTEETWISMPEGWNFTGVSKDEAMSYGYATKEEYTRADTTANLMGAYILSYARIALWEVANEIGFEHLVYCDTDSWKHTNPLIISPLAGDGLGQWKHENTYSLWHSTRPKQYKYHSIWDEKRGTVNQWGARVKGCSLAKAANDAGINYDLFCKELDLNGTITFEGVVGIKESWRSKETRAGQWVIRTKSIGNN